MTWNNFAAWLEEEMDRLRPASFDLPPPTPGQPVMKQFEEWESANRPLVNEWLHQHWVEEREPPLTEAVRYWLQWRLVWAWRWVLPMEFGPLRDERIDHKSMVIHLLVDCWAEIGWRDAREWARPALPGEHATWPNVTAIGR